MSRENETDTDAERPRPTRAQRLAVLAFLAAFALTIITVLWTFHEVHSPGTAWSTAGPRAAEPAARDKAPEDGDEAGENPTRRKEGGETPPGPAR